MPSRSRKEGLIPSRRLGVARLKRTTTPGASGISTNDGEPFLSYHPETLSWKVEPSSAQTLAMEVKNSWDADGIQSKVYQAHVQGELCGRLRRYQVSWKGSSLSSGASAQGNLLSPAVNVTCGEALEDTINMTCWAFGFYPQNISVTWLQDGEPRSQNTQQSWGVFPM
ncbi:MHC class I polypeptide-related sequence B-like isoform X1 [Marmota monax]|uniref:MHC class I polypeptide-related sequence B-like isoform X1 n=1 Tax=Marmota monax TaxID=9995 RepID=UPI0026ECC618|nr:MHC class I polypeptide-related sequence B-like isoform X1 [Marmota monax]